MPCDDGNVCTADSCDSVVGCLHDAKAGACDDENVCTFDGCDPSFGCTHEPADEECSGDDPCLQYVCVDGECTGIPASVDDSLDGVDDDCDGLTDEDAYKEFRLVAGEMVGARGTGTGGDFVLVGELAPGFGGTASDAGLALKAGLVFVFSLLGIGI